jgi:hypothetical protein
MAMLLRKYSLFYLAHAGTFFLLCAYSLAANAPNYPFLPPLFFPIYLSSAIVISERETGDPMLGILPITPREIMDVKFALALVFIVIGWLNIGLFTALQGLSPRMAANVMKLATLCAAYSLLLAAAFQLGLHFFGGSAFRKVIIGFTVVTGVFGILFFIGLAESGHRYLSQFPLNPALSSLPWVVVAIAAAAAGLLYHQVLKRGPWNPGARLIA